MDTQSPPISIARTACKAGSAKSVSWATPTLSRLAGKFSYHKTSSSAQAEPVIEFQPTFPAQGSLAHGRRQQEDVETLSFDDNDYDLIDRNDDLVPEDEGDDKYDQCDYEGEMDSFQDETLKAESDDLLDSLDELFYSVVPRLILTTPEGETITGDDIPEGEKCHYSKEYRTLQQRWLDNLADSLVPGNWKRLRDWNLPEKTPRERHRAEEKKRKRQREKAESQRRRREADAAERARELQNEQAGRYLDVEKRHQGEQSWTWYPDVDIRKLVENLVETLLEKLIEKMVRKNEEAVRKLQQFTDELSAIEARERDRLESWGRVQA
ncbi:hypothetical protein CGRA01v4_04626 [Colletotrichum graminicola]|uniref:Uncharacterized protein n=1 Tax=Colletotrichum graminicola (strain M1.001 / M2 / FGSC 10212) TaxID=645133 RepID=E3Q909_COLGM|nr:uncharacterized protein GLRG_02018 [Colletotrichum graminicola M1.001]EFQ27523.1 hypothetical protein GLRG_02018 [Colletotrichum graminicola M1.001]WDK13345.1 hypothetical protein CGRA01v4_04626 [Colletotrichum graminicola]